MNREVIVIDDENDDSECSVENEEINDDAQHFSHALNEITQLVSRPMTKRQFSSCMAMLKAFVKENVRFNLSEDFQLELIDNVKPLYVGTNMNKLSYENTAYKTILVVLKKLGEEFGITFELE